MNSKKGNQNEEPDHRQKCNRTQQTAGGSGMTPQEQPATKADIARLEGLLTRALGLLCPEPDPLDEQSFLDSLRGLTTDEIRQANRRRNAAIKAKKKEQSQ